MDDERDYAEEQAVRDQYRAEARGLGPLAQRSWAHLARLYDEAKAREPRVTSIYCDVSEMLDTIETGKANGGAYKRLCDRLRRY
jgi:hypothetical protein